MRAQVYLVCNQHTYSAFRLYNSLPGRGPVDYMSTAPTWLRYMATGKLPKVADKLSDPLILDHGWIPATGAIGNDAWATTWMTPATTGAKAAK